MWAAKDDASMRVRGRRDAASRIDFSQLPNEVAEHVLSYLGVGDLYAAALVCRQWSALIASLPAWTDAAQQALGGRRVSRRLATTQEEYKIVMVGPGGAGRNAFVHYFVTGEFLTAYDPVVEASYAKEIEVDGVMATLDLTVTAGQEEFQALLDPVIRQCDGVLVLYSITSARNLTGAANSLRLVRRIREAADGGGVPPIIVLGNKLDLPDDRAIAPAEGKQLADQFGVYSPRPSASAKTTKNKKTSKKRGKSDDDGKGFRFERNFFECSVKENYVNEYDSRFFATPEAMVSPAESTEILWTVHRDQMTVVFEELVRQIDVWRRVARQPRPRRTEGEANNDKKCLVC